MLKQLCWNSCLEQSVVVCSRVSSLRTENSDCEQPHSETTGDHVLYPSRLIYLDTTPLCKWLCVQCTNRGMIAFFITPYRVVLVAVLLLIHR